MDGTLRATCPRCSSKLKIPAQWVGQTVKCKKCGATVRSKMKPAATVPDADEMDSEIIEGAALNLPEVSDAPPIAPYPYPYPQPLPQPSDPTVHGEPFADMARGPVARVTNPLDEPQAAPHDPAPPPGYPYPVPPGYPTPQGFAPPPGYPYPVPPGYPYHLPPGYALPAGYPYAPPQATAYPQHAPPQPVAPQPLSAAEPVPDSSVFKTSEVITAPRRTRYRRPGPANRLVWVGVCVALTCGLVAAGVYGTKALKKAGVIVEKQDEKDPSKDIAKDTKKTGTPGTTIAAGSTPRRMLFVHISNYLFLNPLTSAAETANGSRGPDQVKAATARFAFEWRIPSDQLFVLADTLPQNEARFPLKPVLTGAYEKFFETCRDQDRVVVYFGGHALEKDGKTYLVPAEGEPEEMESLIPLDDFYGKLKDCKATQKVVIWDVCRFNFQRGRQRPGSEPMTEALAKALAAAPPGVQVVTSCAAGENALEFYDLQPDGPSRQRGKNLSIAGSNFLEAMRNVAEKGTVTNKAAAPGDPLPVAEWVAAINKRVGDVATFATPTAGMKLAQTVKLDGAAPESLAAHDPAAPPAARFDLPQPPKGATSGEIGSIETEYFVPPFKSDLEMASLALFPFPADALKDYKAEVSLDEMLKDKEKYKFADKVNAAFQTIREVWSSGADGSKLRTRLEVPVTDVMKKDIKEEQVVLATAILKLETAMADLEDVTKSAKKEDQPKRWQAHHDYALALLKARLAYMHEYDLLMGNIHTDTLPPIDAKLGHIGLKLVTAEKMKSKSEVKKLATEAVELFDKIIKDYPGTPWAMQAKRERGIPLGLAWLPYSAVEDK